MRPAKRPDALLWYDIIYPVDKENITKTSHLVIRWGFILLFFLVPLFFTPYNYELFEYNKMMLVYGLTVVITGSFLIKSVAQGKIEIQRTPFDIPLLLFLLSQVLSTVLSIDRHTSLFGYYSRFHGGLLSTISYIILFYIFTTEFKDDSSFISKCFASLFGSGFLVALYGILQRLGIDKHIWVQDVQNRVFSTLGQPNWLAVFLSVLTIIALALFLKKDNLLVEQRQENGRKFIFLILALIFYTVIIFTKSRSGFAGFWLGFFLMISMLFYSLKVLLVKKSVLVFTLLILTSFIFGTPFSQIYPYTLEGLQIRFKSVKESYRQTSPPSVNTDQTGSIIEYGGTESGEIRRIVWKGAIDIFKHYPLFGTGVETFAYSYYQFRPKEHNLTSEWDFLYNKAHNEYLNFAATSGVFGLSTYILFILVFLLWTVRKYLKNPDSLSILAGITGAYLDILFSNFFGFSVVIVGIFFFILPSFSFIIANEEKRFYKISLPSSKTIMLFIFCAIFYLLFVLIQMWRADKYFNLGHQYNRTNQYIYAYTNIKKAVEINPHEPFFKDELAQVASLLSVVAKNQNETELSDKLKAEALSLVNDLTKAYPKNVNFFKTKTKVFYNLSETDPNLLVETLEAILKAWELSPNDAKIAYNTGLIYAKLGNNRQAIESLKKSAELKPDYYEPRWALALFYEQIGEKEKAVEQLDFILKNIRNDEQAKNKLKQLTGQK